MTRHYDIVMATDFRFPGGTTASVVEEVTAQHRAGHRTGLLQLDSGLIRRPRPFAERIRRLVAEGAAELITGSEPVRTPLLLVRHPTVLSQAPTAIPPVDTDRVVLVVNQVPRDERTYYDVATVHRVTTASFGVEPLWAPISPRVRAAIAAEADVEMTAQDWENVIDLDQWRVDRTGFVSDRPVIGRHSREHWTKWPATAEEVLAAYPDDPAYQVRVLGGARSAAELLGSIPANWTTFGFGAMSVPEFLAGIDFHVYQHHPGLVEAFGRVVLEGLASGAVCFAPPALEPVFGDAVTYGHPHEVRGFVDALYADPVEFARRSARGVALVERRFSHATHLQRIAALVGEPTGHPGATPPSVPTGRTTVVCAIGDRAAEVADVLADWADPSVPVVLTDRPSVQAGTMVETVPADIPAERRCTDLQQRLAHLVHAHRAGRVLHLDPGTEGLETRPAPHRWPHLRDTITQRVRRLPSSWTGLRRAAGVARAAAVRVRSGVRALGDARSDRPVAPPWPHVPADAPVALLVVSGAGPEPEPALQHLLTAVAVSSAFRPVLLAPPSWWSPARRAGVALETWIPESDWPTGAGTEHQDYARARLAEVCRRVAPVVVTELDGADALVIVEAAAVAAPDRKGSGVVTG